MKISKQEYINITMYMLTISIIFGVVTALWKNPFFIRKIEVKTMDYIIFTLFTILASFHLGIESKVCKKSSVFGGVLGFLGFSCPTCNAILVLLLGNSFLMTYFEPIRHIIGFGGLIVLTSSLIRKIKLNILVTKN